MPIADNEFMRSAASSFLIVVALIGASSLASVVAMVSLSGKLALREIASCGFLIAALSSILSLICGTLAVILLDREKVKSANSMELASNSSRLLIVMYQSGLLAIIGVVIGLLACAWMISRRVFLVGCGFAFLGVILGVVLSW